MRRLAPLRIALTVASISFLVGGLAATYEVLWLLDGDRPPSIVAHAVLLGSLIAMAWAIHRVSILVPSRLSLVGNKPPDRARSWVLTGCTLWMLVHLATPLRYYLGDDIYDERFAWRMFSAVRVQRCDVAVTEVTNGSARPVQVMQVLPAPWAALLERGRVRVIDRFLAWRCDEAESTPDEVRVISSCTSPGGERLPARVRAIDCENGALRDQGTPAGDGTGTER